MRVFIIGLHRTGTTSMASALMKLGFTRQRISSEFYYEKPSDIDVPEGTFVYDLAPQHYWFHRVKYPDSKFILTTRDTDSWLKSLNRWMHYKSTKSNPSWLTKMKRAAILGTYSFDDEFLRWHYLRHNLNVLNDFSNDPSRLLVFKTGIDGYKELCDFLEVPRVNLSWPWENKKRQ